MSKRLILPLSFAIACVLAAPSARAIYLNTEAFRATGGDPSSIPATLDKGLASRIARSLEAPFDSVGGIADCTGTWLGNDDRYAWVLTAKHCVTSRVPSKMAFHSPTTAAVGAARVLLPPGHASAGEYGKSDWDVALVALHLQTPAPLWNALTKPLLYDGNSELGRTVHLVGQGVRGIGQSNVGSGRLWGSSKIQYVYLSGGTISAGYSATGPTDLQARAAPGDSGGSAWQQHAGGYWSIVGVTASGNSTHTNFARMSRHTQWIKGVFPGVMTFSERMTVTDTTRFVSRNHADDVDRGAVYYVVPQQSGASGPTERSWVYERGAHSKITVTAKDAISGIERPVVLRATRDSGCGPVRMEDGVLCSSRTGLMKLGPLHVSYHAHDNADLPSGEWKAKFEVEAIGSHRPYRERLPINVDIRNLVQGNVERDKAWVSPNFAQAASRGTVYYVVPSQKGATGPTSRVWGGPKTHSTMHVLVRDAVTGFERNVVLRTSRTTGCSTRQMHDGLICSNYKQGPMTASFNADDNKDLPRGTWRGVAYVRAKGWHDHAVDEAIRVNVDIVQP